MSSFGSTRISACARRRAKLCTARFAAVRRGSSCGAVRGHPQRRGHAALVLEPGQMKGQILTQRSAQPNCSAPLQLYFARLHSPTLSWNKSTRSSPLAGSFRSSPPGACSTITSSRSTRAASLRSCREAGCEAAFFEPRTHRAPFARPAARIRQHTHARGDEPAARRGGERIVRSWLNARDLAARAALDRCRIRARRHGARHRRHAHERYDLLCSTCTCFPKSPRSPLSAARIRACIGLPVVDVPALWADSVDEYFEKGLRLHDEYRDDPLITTALAPYAPWAVSDATLASVRRLADELELPVTMHVNETAAEALASAERPSRDSSAWACFRRCFTAVHMVHVDTQRSRAHGRAPARTSPTVRSRISSSATALSRPRVLESGINVTLGTDGAASNNDLSMLDEMRTAALLANSGLTEEPRSVGARVAARLQRWAAPGRSGSAMQSARWCRANGPTCVASIWPPPHAAGIRRRRADRVRRFARSGQRRLGRRAPAGDRRPSSRHSTSRMCSTRASRGSNASPQARS